MEPKASERKATMVEASRKLRGILREHFDRSRKGPSPIRGMADRILEKEKRKSLREES